MTIEIVLPIAPPSIWSIALKSFYVSAVTVIAYALVRLAKAQETIAIQMEKQVRKQ